jgi:AcrR family transcriptional regulator
MTSSMIATRSPRKRPLRADARRNHERLLTAARATFDERGADACLDDIARRAGVGIGTLYRHFPTRRDLLAAVLNDDIEALCVEAERLFTSPTPGDALISWLRAVVIHAAASRGLAANLFCARPDDQFTSVPACIQMRSAGAQLLARAQTAGDVRPDIDGSDLFTLVNGIAWATEQASGDRETADRLLSLMLDGLRGTEGPRGPLPAAGVGAIRE